MQDEMKLSAIFQLLENEMHICITHKTLTWSIQPPIPSPTRSCTSEREPYLICLWVDPRLYWYFTGIMCSLIECRIISPYEPNWSNAIPWLRYLVSWASLISWINILTLESVLLPLYMNVPNTQPVGDRVSLTAKSTCNRRTSLANLFRVLGFIFAAVT